MSHPLAPDGVLLVDKAEGMTSHDVVALVRRKIQVRKVGHCGTLDPIATGLLLITVGRGTKVQDLLMSEDKEYAGTFVLGVTTDTQDRQGAVIQQRPVPALDETQIGAVFEKFRGDFYQMPPMVSAKKHALCMFIATRSIESGYPRSILVFCAAKVFTFVLMLTTLARP
jgi:tRNA pseudouridine55 synthase